VKQTDAARAPARRQGKIGTHGCSVHPRDEDEDRTLGVGAAELSVILWWCRNGAAVAQLGTVPVAMRSRARPAAFGPA
jgi:hypothetical protein